jgi:hypothetical protein
MEIVVMSCVDVLNLRVVVHPKMQEKYQTATPKRENPIENHTKCCHLLHVSPAVLILFALAEHSLWYQSTGLDRQIRMHLFIYNKYLRKHIINTCT